jgi:AcrR family transcriptional regulator
MMPNDSSVDAIEWNEDVLGRIPSQQRSREKVERILKFSAMAIERDGVYALNLNKVAKEAGVNVATVYQFFPTKNVVIARLALSIFNKGYDALQKSLSESCNNDDAFAALSLSIYELYKTSRSDKFVGELWAIIEADRDLNFLNRQDDERIARILISHGLSQGDTAGPRQATHRILVVLGMVRSAINLAIKSSDPEGELIIKEAIKIAEKALR